MNKRMAGFVVVMVMLLMLTAIVTAEATGSKAVFYIDKEGYELNGTWVGADAAPYIEPLPNGTGRTMMPVRYVALAVGADDVHWDEGLSRVTVIKGRTVIELTINSKVMIINKNDVKTMDVPAIIQEIPSGGGRTMLPVAHLADALGVTYEWNGHNRTVTFAID